MGVLHVFLEGVLSTLSNPSNEERMLMPIPSDSVTVAGYKMLGSHAA